MASPLPPITMVHLDADSARAQVGDEESLQGMLLMLQDALTRDVPAIAQLLAAEDSQQATRLLPALKGFMPIFCRPPVCEHVAQVELASKSQASAQVAIAYAALRPELEQLQQEVRHYLHSRGVAA